MKYDRDQRDSHRSLAQYANVDGDAVSDHEDDADTTNEEALDSQHEESPMMPRETSALNWPKKMKRRNLLLLSLASFIVSIGQSIILPSIETIARDLKAGRAATAATLVNSPMLHFLTSLFPSED